MAANIKLQPLVSTSGAETQDVKDAVDAGAFRNAEAVLQVYSPGSTSGYRYTLLTAAENSEQKYAEAQRAAGTDAVFNGGSRITQAGTYFMEVGQFARFLRWQTTSGAGTHEFEIDLVLKFPA